MAFPIGLLALLGGGAGAGGAGAGGAGFGSLGGPMGGAGGAGGTSGFAKAGAALPALGGIFGGYMKGQKAKKRRRLRRKRGLAELDRLTQLQGMWGGKTFGALKEQRATVKGAYEGARAEVSDIGGASRQRVLDREKQTQGAIQQGLVSRGLASTTRQGSAARGVRSDTDRALLDIDDQVAQLQSGLIAAGGMAEAGSIGNMAEFYQQRSGQDTDISAKRFALLTGGGGGGGTGGSAGGSFDLSGLGPLIAMLGGKKGTSDYQDIIGGTS